MRAKHCYLDLERDRSPLILMVADGFLMRLRTNYFETYSLLSSDTETENIFVISL